MSLSKYEMETIISFSDAEDMADVYTCNRSLMTKLKKASWAKFLSSEKLDGRICSMSFSVPKDFIRIQKKRRVSISQREAAKRNIQKARMKRDSLSYSKEKTTSRVA